MKHQHTSRLLTKALSVTLSATLLLSMAVVGNVFGTTAFAAEAQTEGDYTYVVLDDDTAQITKYNGTQADVTLSAEDLPEGWSGYFRGSDGEVSMMHVGAEQTKEECPKLSYALTVPDEAEDGEYDLTIRAEGSGMEAETMLHINITREEAGQSDFTAEYPEQEGDASTNFSFDTTIINNRVTPQSYSLSAQAPEGWTVSFTPSGESSKVASLPVDAGKTQGITVAVKPSETVEKGEYTVTLSAISAEGCITADG